MYRCPRARRELGAMWSVSDGCPARVGARRAPPRGSRGGARAQAAVKPLRGHLADERAKSVPSARAPPSLARAARRSPGRVISATVARLISRRWRPPRRASFAARPRTQNARGVSPRVASTAAQTCAPTADPPAQHRNR